MASTLTIFVSFILNVQYCTYYNMHFKAICCLFSARDC